MQYLPSIKVLNELGIEGKFLKLIIFTELTANIITNDEKLKVFQVRPGTRQGYPLSSRLLSHSTVLDLTIR
jgi:hypothetical protein